MISQEQARIVANFYLTTYRTISEVRVSAAPFGVVQQSHDGTLLVECIVEIRQDQVNEALKSLEATQQEKKDDAT